MNAAYKSVASSVRIVLEEVMCESVGVFIAKTVAVELNVNIVPKDEMLTS